MAGIGTRVGGMACISIKGGQNTCHNMSGRQPLKDQKKILEVWLKIVPGVANSVPEW